MSNLAMIVDYKYCTGCFSCEISCRNEKGFPLDEYGIKVYEERPVKLEGKWEWNYFPIISRLCDKCEDRIEGGELPACQLHCLAQCIEVLPLEEAAKRMAEMGEGVACLQ